MSEISIEWLTDSHSCETCGSSYAEGAIVSIDGNVAIEMRPIADCFGGDNFDQEQVFERILQHFGHTVAAPTALNADARDPIETIGERQ